MNARQCHEFVPFPEVGNTRHSGEGFIPVTPSAFARPSLINGNDLFATQRFLNIVPGFSALLPRRRTDVKALSLDLPIPREPVGIVTLMNCSLSPAAQTFIARVGEPTKPLAKG